MKELDPKLPPTQFQPFHTQLVAAEWLFAEAIAGWHDVYRKRDRAPQDYAAYVDSRRSTLYVQRLLSSIEESIGTSATLRMLEDAANRTKGRAA